MKAAPYMLSKPKKMIDGLKHCHCSGCNQFVVITGFHKRAYMLGTKSLCKVCVTQKSREYRRNKTFIDGY